jgi:hypothetical protein
LRNARHRRTPPLGRAILSNSRFLRRGTPIGDGWSRQNRSPKFDAFRRCDVLATGVTLSGTIQRALSRCRQALDRRARLRERACLRCGRPATTVCRACGARVCNRCWDLSVDSGSPARLCIDCLPSDRPRRLASRLHGGQIFRSGARILGLAIASVTGLAYWRSGWPGAWAVVGSLFNPAIVLGLVPLAFVLGALHLVLLRVLRSLLRGSVRRSA